MANQKPTITGAIRFKGQVYKAGDEEAFAKAYGKSSMQALVDKGVISGGESEPAAASAATKEPTKATEPAKEPEKTPAPPTEAK